jgi:hypothetical protein
MSPASYQTAPPRNVWRALARKNNIRNKLETVKRFRIRSHDLHKSISTYIVRR